MFKLIKLIVCFILINNYGQSKKWPYDQKFENDFPTQQASSDQHSSQKYDFKESFRNNFSDFKTKSIDLDSSANEVDVATGDAPTYFENTDYIKKQDQRFSKWFDIGEHSNQTSEQSSNVSNLRNVPMKSSNKLKSKKKWRLVSSSVLSDTSIDDNGFTLNKNFSLNTKSSITKKQLKRKAKKLKTANLDLKVKESNNPDDYVKNRIANTTVYTFNRKDDLKFKLNDAIDYKSNYESNRIRTANLAPNRLQHANDTLGRRTQLSGESSKISKKIMLATMLPSMIKGLTSSHTHFAVLPTTHVAQPIAIMPSIQPMPVHVPVPQIHIVAPQPPPRPVYHHHIIARPPSPTQIVAQPIYQQPIIQQPIIHQQPIVHKRIITQPIIVNRPAVHVMKQQIYQPMNVESNCNPQVSQEDSGEEMIGDPLDDEDNTSVQQDDGDAYSQNSWGQQEQMRFAPQPVAQSQDAWDNQPSFQNQKVYHYHTASVPKSTRTIYTQTKMMPSITSVQSTTSYTPEHKHTIVETEHNMKPVMNLVSTSNRKLVGRPMYTMKAIPQTVMQTVQQQPAYVADNQGSWSK